MRNNVAHIMWHSQNCIHVMNIAVKVRFEVPLQLIKMLETSAYDLDVRTVYVHLSSPATIVAAVAVITCKLQAATLVAAIAVITCSTCCSRCCLMTSGGDFQTIGFLLYLLFRLNFYL